MAIPRPSASRPLATVLALVGLALLLRRDEEPREDEWRLLAERLLPAERLPLAGEALPAARYMPPEWRDALAAVPAGGTPPRLVPTRADWNALRGHGAPAITVARWYPSGKVTVTQARPLPVPSRARPSTRPPQAPAAARPGRDSPSAARSAGAGAASRAPKPPRRRAAPVAAGEEEDPESELELDEAEEDETEDVFADPSRGRTRGGLGARIRSWFRTTAARRAARRRRQAARLRRTLKELLGKGILRPPAGRPQPPDFAALGPPPPGPDGRPVGYKPLLPREVERAVAPDGEPGYKGWWRDGRKPPHWHPGEQGQFYHAGSRWGLFADGPKWAWFLKSGSKWWTLGGKIPLIRHGERWWWRTEEGWFLLHDGKAWAYRFYEELKRDGLFDPRTQARVIYSEDGRRVAIQIPGVETIVYDLETRQELGRVPAEPRRGWQ